MRPLLLFFLLVSPVAHAKLGLCVMVGTFVFESEKVERLSYEQVEDIVEKALYKDRRRIYAENPDRPHAPNWLGRQLPQSVKGYLRREAMLILTTQDIVSGLKQLGAFRESTTWELVTRRWFRDHPLTSDMLESIFWNAYTKYKFGQLFHAPALRLLRARLRRPEVLLKIREKGFDAVFEELEDELGVYARIDIVYSAIRTTYYRYLIYELGKMMWVHQNELKIIFDPRTWIFAYQWANTSDDDLKKKQDKDFAENDGANRVRREQFESFREAYNDTEGPFDEPLPAPWEPDYEERLKRFPAGYKEEADDLWKTLKETPDEELKAEFPAASK